MARPESRFDPVFELGRDPSAVPRADTGYQPGGQIRQMQADLAQRLAQAGLAPTPADAVLSERADERVIRFLSVAGGYLALLGGYAGVALVIVRAFR